MEEEFGEEFEDRESEGSTMQVRSVGNLCEYTRRTLSRSRRCQWLPFRLLKGLLPTSIKCVLFGSARMICNLKAIRLSRWIVVDIEIRAFVEPVK